MSSRLRMIRERLIKLNLFDTETNDEHIKRNELLSTRIYLFILLTLLLLLTFYEVFQMENNLINIEKPNKEEYEKFKLIYLNNLKCPCQQISISYKEFVNLTVEYNEICLSDFISEKWINYLFYDNTSYYFQLDFRHDASSKFQLLRLLCQLAEITINESLNEFYSLNFITNEVITSELFFLQVHSFIDLFKQTTIPSFQNLLQLIRQITIANGIYSAIDTSLAYALHPSNISRIYLDSIYYYENSLENKIFDCYCDEYTACQMPQGIYSTIEIYDFPGSDWIQDIDVNATTAGINATFLIPGMYVGCKPIESLMRSTSQCLYDKKCLNQIASYINHTTISINSFQILNQFQSKSNLTFQILANQLFIENWIINISYDNYYYQCQPLFCQFTIYQRQNFIHIFAIIISFFGGLRIVLRFIIPIIIKFIRRKKHQQQLTTTNSIILTDDEHKQKNGRLSTKLYFLTIIICLIIFSIRISSEYQPRTIIISNPTKIDFEQLNNKSIDDLYCPCNEISIKYSNFLHLNPTYHEICSSIFASNMWYNAYEIWNITLPCYYPSFANLASFYFSLLLTFCQSANETISNGLTQFYSSDYITSEVILENQFNNEILSYIELFQTNIQNTFEGQWNLLQSIISNNQIISVRKTDFILNGMLFNNTLLPYSYIKSYNNCHCATDSTCHETVRLCIPNRQDFINGIFIGCYMVDSLLLSTTECFYNQTCLNTIQFYMFNSSQTYQNLNILNQSQSSQYKTNETIGTILKNLFIENWNEFYSYENYYNQCKPSFCSYTIQQRPSFIYICTKLIAVYGGLTIIIKFLIPNIINLIRRKKQQQQQQQQIASKRAYILGKLINLNLFRDRSTNEEKIRKQIITTRLYIIVFLIILIILVLYTSLNKKSITVELNLLNLNEYTELEMKYKNTLICPCNDISIEYNKFIDIKLIYHEICYSDFVSKQWFNYLYNDQTINDRNYHSTASAQFQTLSSLCKLTQDTLNTSLIQFYSTKFISGQLISSQSFQNQFNLIIELFQKSVPQTFKRTLDMIHGIIHANFYMTVYQTNWKFTILERKNFSPIYSNPIIYNQTCNCGTSSKCFQPLIIDNTILDGLGIGCYPVQTMLQSSLQCLYNQTCLNLILSYFRFNQFSNNINNTFEILKSQSEYGRNETVESMVNRLFVDQWYINHSYENYYKQCKPTLCTYSYTQYFNIFYIITTILGLYGGLTNLLKLILPFIIKIIFKLFSKTKIHIQHYHQNTN
ncbi:unnamed protein product [Adineta steineri]|uniref:Transmembrane protein n=1 Tax=Adineta steineri TaxID=433720 RepID=A0A814R6X8_9BILA|nr:unnamed protein product [Adineta steineri]CAF1442948.1 unnamed protein product [Adineta steineri]